VTDEFLIALERSSDNKVLIISVAARMAGMHPQTLRQYDRMGLVSPGRTPGGGRRYSARDVTLLREIQRLSQEEGVNLAGIKRIIELEQLVTALQHRIANVEHALEMAHRRLAEYEASHWWGYACSGVLSVRETPTALVVWRPRRRNDG